MKSYQDLEERLREHLSSERESIRPPLDLDATLLHALQQETVNTLRTRGGVPRQLLLAAALLVFALGLGFGIARLHAINEGPIEPSRTVSPSIRSSASPTPTASPITSPRPAA